MQRTVLIGCMSVALLAGCATTKETQFTVTKTQYVILDIPSTMLAPIDYPPPPKEDVYLSASIPERETMLATYSIQTLQALRACNANLLQIKAYQDSAHAKMDATVKQ